MINTKMLFSLCKKCFLDDEILKSYNETNLIAARVRDLLSQRKQIVSREELRIVRDFSHKSIGIVNHPDVLTNVVLSNADYDFYFALMESQDKSEKLLTFKSLPQVSKLSAYSILAFIYPLEYSFMSSSACAVVSALCLDVEHKRNLENRSVGFEKSIYEKANNYFCGQYKAAGFDSAAEFSVHILALYRYMYHNVEPRRRKNLSTDEMTAKIIRFISDGYADHLESKNCV